MRLIDRFRGWWWQYRLRRWWAGLRAAGMRLGSDVWLPRSTWVDTDHCHLITIEDHCGFGEQCMILAHDAQMDEFLDATRIGRVTIRASSHIGARTLILPGVEIGPRTIVGANSVVSRSLPPETVCVGSPAKPVCSLSDYLAKHQALLAGAVTFPYEGLDTEAARAAQVAAVAQADCYVVGGRLAERSSKGGTPRT
jgi:maltose O-acetyltransferase